MILQIPNVKGWLLVGVIAVAVAALMWARTTGEEVFLQMERKFESWRGGWIVL